jgi:hypothetical protein
VANIIQGPTAPAITARMLYEQVKLDVQGKEVQRAATYSYTWLADQVGHICIGVILSFVLTATVSLLARHALLPGWLAWIGEDANLAGFGLAFLAVSIWEYGAYRLEIHEARGSFPLDHSLLRQNALIAAAYMVLGGLLGWAFHLSEVYVLGAVGLVALVAIALAPFWLRQKIVWQKAGLPYLFRLANAHHDLGREDAQKMHGLVSSKAPPLAQPQRIVIAGPVNSGRTSLASGIGTEFAFRGRSVRYLSFDRLVEFVAATDLKAEPLLFCDEIGPVNVSFWPWPRVQVLIIDDISPLLGTVEDSDHHRYFTAMLEGRLAQIRSYLAMKHTVWILGDLDDGELDRFAATISRFCDGDDRAPGADNLIKVLLSKERKVKITAGGCDAGFAERSQPLPSFADPADSAREQDRAAA